MTLRDQIAGVITSEIGVDIDFTIQGQHDVADAIITLFREALLSDEAVQKAGFNIWAEVADGTMNADIYREEGVEIAVTALTAALDAVTGEDPS